MIFVSFNQLKAVYITLFIGLAVFLLVFFLKVLFCYSRGHLIFKNILLGIFTIIYGVSFVVIINLFNYGKYNIPLVVFYLVTIFLVTKSSQKLLDFLSLKVYAIYKKIYKWGKFYIAGKVKSLED